MTLADPAEAAAVAWNSKLDHGHALGHALAEWLRRDARWAMVPQRLLDHAAAASLDGNAWAALADLMPTRCRRHESAGTASVPLWLLCLLEVDHAGVCGYEATGELEAAALAEQMDPIGRVARRAAHAAGMTVGVLAYVEVT